jgi:hypothetical protein
MKRAKNHVAAFGLALVLLVSLLSCATVPSEPPQSLKTVDCGIAQKLLEKGNYIPAGVLEPQDPFFAVVKWEGYKVVDQKVLIRVSMALDAPEGVIDLPLQEMYFGNPQLPEELIGKPLWFAVPLQVPKNAVTGEYRVTFEILDGYSGEKITPTTTFKVEAGQIVCLVPIGI